MTLQANRPAAADMILGEPAIISQIRGSGPTDHYCHSTGPSDSTLTKSQAQPIYKRKAG